MGKEGSKDDAMKSELEKDGLALIMGKGVNLFFIYNEYHSTHAHTPPPILQTLHSQRLLLRTVHG